MIKKNIKKCALFCLLAVLVCSVCVIFTQPLNNVKGGTVTFEIANVSDTNRVGTEITLGSEITATYKGSKVTFTNGSITYPNGKTYSVGTHKLTDVGTYSVKYYYKDGNVIVTAEKKFTITNNYYDLSSSGGTITAITGAETEGMVLDTNADDVMLNNKDGLILRMKDGCQFIYNTPIDLSKTNEDGIAEIINLNYRQGNLELNDNQNDWYDFMCKQDDAGNVIVDANGNKTLLADFYYKYISDTAERCKIRLTDAYDSNIYVEFDNQIARLATDPNHVLYPQNYRVSGSAAANGQVLHGCREGNTATDYGPVAEIDGKQYQAYKNWNRATFPGGLLTSSASTLKDGTTWGYDMEKNIVYMKGSYGRWYVVNELDNSTIYPDNPFKGFTTGEVYLSIYFSDYAGADDARVDIYSIAGKSGAELVDMYGKGGRVDYTAPEITINYEETDEGVIYAPLNSEVEIPSAFVKEVFSDRTYSVNAYTNYGTQYQKLVTIKNNKVKLTENAVYTLEYSAVDNSGQKGVSTMKICPVQTKDAIWVETNKLTSVEAGDLITLPEYVIKTINKEESIKYSVKVVGEKETINIDPALNTFRPQYTGKYKVVFEYSDNAYSGIYEYEFDVVGSNKVKFLTAPVLPKYLINGDKYYFEELKGYIYSTSAVKVVNADAYVSVDGGEFTKINHVQGYKINATDNIKLKYVKDGSESAVAEAKVISNVNENGTFRLYKYFVGDYTPVESYNVAGRPINNDVVYRLNQTSGNQTLEFANIVDTDSFVFQFKPGTTINYSALSFVLTDIYDENNKLVVRYYTKGTGYVISVNGVESYISSSFANEKAIYSIEYNKALKRMNVNGYTFNYGFENFTSTSAYFDVTFENINGPIDFNVEKVGNHVFRGTKTKDDVAPVINVVTSDGSYEVGTKVMLNAPIYSDVISQIDKPKTTITIEQEDGSVIKLDDVYSEYELTLDKFGAYTITYETMDTAGVRGRYRYTISVVDRQAPEIVINDYAEDSMIVVKYLTVFKLNYTVTDNMSEVENVKVSVRLENLKTGEILNPLSTTEIKLNQEGDFAVYIVAVDEVGNLASKTIYLRVEGGK